MKQGNRHKNLVNKIAEILKEKPYVDGLFTELEYPKGELDIFTKQGNRFVYYEVKSSNTEKGFAKANKQLMRWTSYKHKKWPHLDFYGVYICPGEIKMVCKNDRYKT